MNVFRFRAKHTNRISGKNLSWCRLQTGPHFEYEIQFHNVRIKLAFIYNIATSQSEKRIHRPMPGPFPALPIFLGKKPWERGWWVACVIPEFRIQLVF